MPGGSGGEELGIDRDLARARVRMGLFGLDEPRRRVGRYEIVGQLGRGAMGVVFAAEDAELRRRVAIKLLHIGGDARGATAHHLRLQAEARAMARISHPNVVSVFEVGRLPEAEGGHIFVVMEHVDGVTLRRWVADERPAWREIVAAYAQAARGLAAAHRAGIVHRDFKPDNVMIDRHGRVRVADFGVARAFETLTTERGVLGKPALAQVSDGGLAGTPAYMAPEQLLGGATDARCDQWSLCVSLWEALWGARPFAGQTASALAVQLLEATEAPTPPDARVPAAIVAAIRRGLAPDPEHRFADADELARALMPARARWRGPIVGAGAVIAAAVGFFAFKGEEPCPRDPDAFASAWSRAVADEVSQAFESTGVGHASETAARTISSLDAYRSAWLDQRHAACAATRIEARQDEARLDQRIRCLDRRREQAEALAARLRRPDADMLEHVRDAIDGLIPPTRCDDDAFLATADDPPAPTHVAEFAAIHAELDLAQVSLELGDPHDALERVGVALARAEPLASARLLADIGARRAVLLSAVGEFDDARATLEDAFFAAKREGLHERASQVALELSASHSARAEADSADHWLRAARSAHGVPAKRPDDFEFEYLEVARYAADSAGDYPRALELARQAEAALDLADEGRRERHSGPVYTGLAHQWSQAGRLDEAVSAAARAVEGEVARYGPKHPQAAVARGVYADALSNVGRFDEALDQVRQQIAVREAMGEQDSAHLATALLRYGVVLQRASRYSEALEYIDRAIEMLARHEVDTPLWVARYTRAMVYEEVDKIDLALVEYERLAIEIAAKHGDAHPFLAALFSNAAMIEFDQGRLADARDLFERALAIRERLAVEGDTERIGTLVGLARTVQALRDHPRAVALLRQAMALSRGSALTVQGIHAELALASALVAEAKSESQAIIADLRQRCDAAASISGLAKPCELVTAWSPDPTLAR